MAELALVLYHASIVAFCLFAVFVLLLNLEYIDIHIVSDICVTYVHVLAQCTFYIYPILPGMPLPGRTAQRTAGKFW